MRSDDGHGGCCREFNEKMNEYDICLQNIFDIHLQNIFSQWSQKFTDGLDMVCEGKRGVQDHLLFFDSQRWVDYGSIN